MPTIISNSPEDTIALGERWGREARPGSVFGLSGDLGAGKTQLVRGIARGLSSPARVHSPTFALLNEYPGGRLTLFHIDLYRLESPEEVLSAGLEEYFFRPGALTVVEWAERLFSPDPGARRYPGLYRHVNFQITGGQERTISYEDLGP